METNKVYKGNNIDVLKTFPDNSIDSIVTDPPYGLGKAPDAFDVLSDWLDKGYHEVAGKGFMGKEWDSFVPQPLFWKEIYRVLKPGGHVLSFAGSRTYDWMVMAVRLAGFEIRDMVAWIYSSGFPKSLDVSKAVESKILNGKSNSRTLRKTEQDGDGKEYTLKGRNNGIMGEEREYDRKTFEPQTDQAKQWQGFGTALKPAIEPVVLARKPIRGTVAENVLKYGTGGINVDGCRVGDDEISVSGKGSFKEWQKEVKGFKSNEDGVNTTHYGRFPANVIHDGSDEVVALFPNDGEQSAARFFYTAKAQQSERDMGLYGFEEKDGGSYEFRQDGSLDGKIPKRCNIHPTVKPIDLMRYLCRLVTPPNGIVLDPFLGSGTTAAAAKLEGFQYIGIEMEEEYCKIAEARIAECDKDYKTKAEALKDDHVAEVYDIFDFMKE